MPIGVGGVVVVPPPPPPPVVTPKLIDLPSAAWLDPYLAAWPLTDTTSRYFTTVGVAGLQDAVTLTISADPEDGGGETIRYVYPNPRYITWPLYVEGRTHAEFLALWRALAKAFTSTTRRGPGTLFVARPDGSVRSIAAYYQDGWAGDPALLGVRRDLAVMTLRCPDPYWQDVQPTVITRTGGGAGVSALAPFLTVSSSAVLGATKVVNIGDTTAWPVWTLTGPLATFTATNLDTGEAWTLDVSTYRGSALLAGEQVVITTKPQTILGPDGTSWAGAISWPSAVLWGIADGPANISFAATGSTSATSIVGTFVPRYETA